MTNVALTMIGDDRPGLVSELTAAVADLGGNWLDSQMARLAGKFAGIALVDIPEENLANFEERAREFGAAGLTITTSRTAAASSVGRTVALQLIGNDHPGIIAEITRTIAGLGVTIDELTTGIVAAPMAGGLLFQADALLRVPTEVPAAEIRSALEPIAQELMVDIEVRTED